MEIRSRYVSRCGLVKRPVRSPIEKSSESIIRDVVVLPFVPPTWIVGYESCGEPSASTSALIRSRVGAIRFSGQRARSAASIASTRA